MSDTFRLNGDPRPWRADLTVGDTLEEAGVEGTWFAVAVNGTVVPAARWATACVPCDGDVDVLQPCQGG